MKQSSYAKLNSMDQENPSISSKNQVLAGVASKMLENLEKDTLARHFRSVDRLDDSKRAERFEMTHTPFLEASLWPTALGLEGQLARVRSTIASQAQKQLIHVRSRERAQAITPI